MAYKRSFILGFGLAGLLYSTGAAAQFGSLLKTLNNAVREAQNAKTPTTEAESRSNGNEARTQPVDTTKATKIFSCTLPKGKIVKIDKVGNQISYSLGPINAAPDVAFRVPMSSATRYHGFTDSGGCEMDTLTINGEYDQYVVSYACYIRPKPSKEGSITVSRFDEEYPHSEYQCLSGIESHIAESGISEVDEDGNPVPSS